MNCVDCLHGVVMNASLDRDVDLRDIISCDLIRREVRRLVECSRYEGMKREVVSEERTVKLDTGEIAKVVDLGYGAVPKKKGWPLGKKRSA